MLTLATGEFIAADCDAASVMNYTIFGMEKNGSTEDYKILAQGQLSNTVGVIYTAPGSNTSFIRTIIIVNTDTVARSFQLFANGTTLATSISSIYVLQAGESAVYEDGQGWKFTDINGQLKQSVGQAPLIPNYGPSGCKAETFPRQWLDETNVSLLSTGRVSMQSIWLVAGTVLTSISISSATTAANTPTNQLFGLYDGSRNLLATTSNDTTTAWGANTVKTLHLTAQYTVPSTGLYYIGVMVTATTVPTIKGNAAPSGSQLHGLAPILNGTSSTGITTTLPNPAAAITVTTTSFWACVN